MHNLSINQNKIFLTWPHPELFGSIIDKKDTKKFPGMVQVTNSVYGLANSPRSFEVTFTKILNKIGFDQQVNYNWGFFTSFYFSKELGFIITHVDDIMILSKNPSLVLQEISKIIKIKGNMNPERFLVLSLEITDLDIEIGLEHSINKLVEQLPPNIKQLVQKMSTGPSVLPTNLAFKFLSKFDINGVHAARKTIDIEAIALLEKQLHNTAFSNKFAPQDQLDQLYQEFDLETMQRIN